MSEPLIYCRGVTLAEFYILRDPLEIDSELWEWREAHDDFERRAVDAFRLALRRIQELTDSGDIDAERARIRTLLGPGTNPKPIQISERTLRLWDSYVNVLNGRRSPDPKERKLFEAYYQKNLAPLAALSPLELRAFEVDLALLRPAKRKGGRPGISPPWRNCAAQLDAMQKLVKAGISIPEAARAVVDRHNPENRAIVLARHFRDRLRLRKLNPGNV